MVHGRLYRIEERVPSSHRRYVVKSARIDSNSHSPPPGFDLVGHEDSLVPLIDYIEPLTEFPEMQKKAGVHIPYIFHAGETLGDGNAPDANLYDAILLGTKRIGHGFVNRFA